MSKKSDPKAYTAPHDVFTADQYTKAGEVFVTDAKKGENWEEVTTAEKAAIEASTEQVPGDPPIEGLSLDALKALAVTKNVNPEGLNKKDLITAIKAANEPRL